MAAIVQSTFGGGTASPVSKAWTTTPVVGNKLVAVVNSATTVTTPAGWTARSSLVNSQGFYVYEKTAVASEPAFSVVTNGNWPTMITLLELNAAEVGAFDLTSGGTESSGALTTKAITSITTTGATAGDFVIAVIALHGATALPTSPVWNNSFTALHTTSWANAGTASDQVAQFVATRSQAPAGVLGATTPTWTNAASNVYGIQFAYQALSGGGGGGGGALTATIADNVAVTDAGGSQTLDVGDASNDSAGVTDQATTAQSFARTASDPVAVTDAVTVDVAGAKTGTAADQANVTDAASTQQDMPRTLADPVAASDTAGVTIGAARGPADPVAGADQVTTTSTLDRQQADPVAVTDTATATLTSAGNSAIGDPAAVTDQATTQANVTRSNSDPVAVSDAVVAQLDRVVTVADFLALTDAAGASSSGGSNPGDGVGLGDGTATALAAVRVQADGLAVSDSAVAVLTGPPPDPSQVTIRARSYLRLNSHRGDLR